MLFKRRMLIKIIAIHRRGNEVIRGNKIGITLNITKSLTEVIINARKVNL